MRLTARILALCLVLACFTPLSMAPAALAHPTRSFVACAARHPRGPSCTDAASYGFGHKVYLRAKVSPPHAGFFAAVLRLDPRSNVWMRVDQVKVSDSGRMRFEWKTTIDDANRKPYRFKFKIDYGHHGHSNPVQVWVIGN